MAEGKTEKFVHVSLIELISNKTNFHGKTALAEGYAVIGFENISLSLTKDNAEYGITKNGVWIDFEEQFLKTNDIRKLNGKWIFVVGKFDANEKGHLGLWSGSVTDINRVGLLRKQ